MTATLDGSGSIPHTNGMMSASAPHGTQEEHAPASRIQNNSSTGQPLHSPAAVEGWFHELNNHVTSQCQGLGDDEPFYPEGAEHGYSGENPSSSDPLHDPILSQMRNNNNNNELENAELRGIVDDLTLEIKRLKNKLRGYKERDPPRLQRDKLFEVRTYGLSCRKKRQLERILERFAAEITSGPRPTRNKTSLKKKPLTGNYDALPLGQESWKILVASLFKQCFNQAMGPATRLEPLKPSQSSNSWQDVNELLESLKHTLAVIDIDFSLQAIKDYGAPLELSPDGRSVRLSENSVQESIQTQGSAIEPAEQHASRQQANDTTKKNTMHKDIVLGFVPNDHIQLPTNHTDSADFLPYTLKACGNDADDDFLSMVSSDSEIISQQPTICQAHRQALGAPPPTQTKSQDRLTYYRNATFYTDCAGDKPTATDLIAAQATAKKDTGEKRKRQSSANSSRCRQKRHDISSAAHRFQNYPTEKDSALNLSQCSSPALSLAQEPLTSAMDESKALPLELEASGVGDVAPDDNFAVHVVMKHVPVSPEDDSDGGSRHSQREGQVTDKLCNQSDQSRLLSRPFFKDIMTSESSRNEKLKDENKKLYRTHLVTATHESLAPSSLPPATCGVFSSSSSDEDAYSENYDSDCEEDSPHVQDEKARKCHDISRRNKAGGTGVTGQSTTSAHAIEQWNAEVLT